MARIEFHGFVEVPDAFLEDADPDALGYRVRVKATIGTITTDSSKLTERDSGERTKTRTYGLRLSPDTKVGEVLEPTSPVLEGQESLDNVRPINGDDD